MDEDIPDDSTPNVNAEPVNQDEQGGDGDLEMNSNEDEVKEATATSSTAKSLKCDE